MATPTEERIQTMLASAIDVLYILRAEVATGSGNLVTLLATFEQSLKGDSTSAASAAMDVIREALATGLSPSTARAILDPLLCDYARLLGYVQTDAEAILDRLYVEFEDNSKSVETRNISFGTPIFSGHSTGNGTIRRITVDGYERAIESLRSMPKVGETGPFGNAA